jgi:hypothetical protein
MLTGITAPGGGGEGLQEAELSDAVDIKGEGRGDLSDDHHVIDMVNLCFAVPVPFPLAIQTTGSVGCPREQHVSGHVRVLDGHFER